MPRPTQYTPIKCNVIAQSDDSVLCRFEEDDEINLQELWVPLKNIDPDDVSDNEAAWDEVEELSIATWWLDSKGVGY